MCSFQLEMLPIWKLLGFVLYVILYFTVLEPYEKWPTPSLKSCLFKIFPIIHIIFIILSSSTEENHTKSHTYRRYIFIGLLFSLGGDIALVYIDSLFEVGVLLFAVAQAMYIAAFGFQPLGSGPMAASFGVVGTALYVYVTRDLKEGIDIKVLLLVYTVLILTMAWRATVQFARDMTIENFCAFVGSFLFVVSDLILSFDKWKGSFYLAPFWNMVTYYLAQLTIGLSACNTYEARFRSKTE